MTSQIVVAIASTTFFIDSQRIHVQQGTAWAAESEVVKQRPDLFSDEPHYALGLDIVPPTPAHIDEAPVEQKTAAPGEKHDTKRRGFLRRS